MVFADPDAERAQHPYAQAFDRRQNRAEIKTTMKRPRNASATAPGAMAAVSAQLRETITTTP